MRLQFQDRPWDLYFALGYTFLVSSVLVALGVGNLFGLVLVLLVPGYVLVAALFPNGERLDWIERFVLSFGLSIAVVPMLGLALNFTPFGIGLAPTVATIAIFVISVGVVAYWRRMSLPPGTRLSATVNLAMPRWREYSALDKGLALGLAASTVVALGTIAFMIVAPPASERFTQFFVLGPGGNATGYPTELNLSQAGNVVLGIVNHEAANIDYTVRVDIVGIGVLYNATSRRNETVELNRTTRSWYNVTLSDNRNWTLPYSFSISARGLWKIQFLLYKDGALTTQELHLFIRVS